MLKLSKTSTYTRVLTVRLPTDDPERFDEATIQVKYRLVPRNELTALAAEGDSVLIEKVVADIHGLSDGEGQALTGDAAMAELLEGGWSAHLQGAIVTDLFGQFGEVLVKNSRPSRGR